MRFRDIIGQESIKRQLRLSVQEGRIPHAQFFVGPEGSGKLQLAIAYAQYVNCTHRTDEDSCGQCPTCLQFEKLQHPDLHFAFPIVKTDAGDKCDDFIDDFRQLILNQHYFSLPDWYRTLGVETKQGMIYEKESGEIIRKLSLKSFGDGYKVMIVWQPDKMNIACANKLLKLLEEPPAQTLFLFVGEHPEAMLTTVLSRLQQIHIPALSKTEALQTKSSDENNENTQFFNDFVALMRNAWLVGRKKDYSALLALRKWSLDMADAKVGRERQKAFLQFAQQQVRENYIFNFQHHEMNDQTPDEQAFSQRFAPFIHAGNVEAIMNELQTAENQIGQNGNAKIIFFDLCLQMIVLIKK